MKYLFLILFLLFISCSKDSFIKEEIVLIEEKQETINNGADSINEQEKIKHNQYLKNSLKKNFFN